MLLYFTCILLPCVRLGTMPLSHESMSCYVHCDCGISWSYSLVFSNGFFVIVVINSNQTICLISVAL